VNIIARTVISKLKTRAIRQLFGRTEEKNPYLVLTLAYFFICFLEP